MQSVHTSSPCLSRWLGFPDQSRLPENATPRPVIAPEFKLSDTPRAVKRRESTRLRRLEKLARLADRETLSSTAMKIYGNKRATRQTTRLLDGLVNDGWLEVDDSTRPKIYVKVKKHD